jgi:dienelactone hydrolase
MTDDWRERFRAPLIWEARLAGARTGRGLVVASLDGASLQLYAWDVPSGRLDAQTGAALGVIDGWMDPTGTHVYFLRDPDGSEHGHLTRVPVAGGEPVDLTPAMPPYTLRGVGFNATGTMIAINPVNADGFAVYAIDLVPGIGEPRLLYRDTWETWGALPSARGDLVACWSTARARGIRRYTVLVLDTTTGALVGELGDGRAKVVGVGFSPVDGDDRILASTTHSGFTRPVIWNPRTGDRHDIPLPDLTGDVEPLDWSPDGRRILLCRLAGAQQLYVYDLQTGNLRALAHPPGTYVLPLDSGPGFGPDDTIVAMRHTAQVPPEVVELDARTGAQRRVLLSTADAPPGRPWRSVTFESADGTPVQAWVATPDGDGPWPTILETHGGPHYTALEGYDPGVQCWLDHGYAWISVNFRGSLGFGVEFAEQIWGDMGRLELQDMVAARDFVVRGGIARPDEVFAFGASYGGYLTLFALGRRPDLWVGGMGLACDADLALSYEDASEALKAAMAGWMKGTPAQRPDAYANSSPITYAADFAAPVLIIQARNDTRTPPRQIEVFERRMRELGKELEVTWLDGGHQSVGPDMLIHVFETMLDFAGRTLARKRAAAGS